MGDMVDGPLLGSERLVPPTPIRDRLERSLMDFRRSGGPSIDVQTILVSSEIYYGLQEEMREARLFPSGALMFRGIPMERADVIRDTIIFMVKPYPETLETFVAVPVREWYIMAESRRLSFGTLLDLTEEKVKPEPIWTPTNIRNRKLLD